MNKHDEAALKGFMLGIGVMVLAGIYAVALRGFFLSSIK